MNRVAIVLFAAGLVSAPAIADDLLSSYEVEQCVDMANEIEDHRRVVERHKSRIQRAEQVLHSYGCYLYGNRWDCPNYLTPQQQFNVEQTHGAREESVRIINRNVHEGNRIVDRYNRQCSNAELKKDDRVEACRFEDNRFCNQFD